MPKFHLLLVVALSSLAVPAVDLSDLMNPDSVMLRRPAAAKAATPASASVPASAPVPKAVAEPSRVVVVETNVVTDIVVQTNVVTDVVTQTNVVTQTDIVVQTNVVTQTDIVVLTNVVTDTRLDDSEKKALEEQRNQAVRDAVVERSARVTAEEARGAAEKKAVEEKAARAQAEAEMQRMKAELAKAEEARRLAEAKLKAAETKAAVAEKKAAAAETAREEVASQVDGVARQALDERKARERAEAEMRAAERRAENERAAALAVAQKLDAITNVPPPTIETPDYAPDRQPAATVTKKASKDAKAGKDAAQAPKKELTGRDAVITADRMDFDRKEGVILFDRNVYVDDEQYQMHADRLFVFLETNAVTKAEGEKKSKKAEKVGKAEKSGIAGLGGGSTALKRLVAIGNVSITNDQRSAFCARATYAKSTGKIVMYGSDAITPWILDPQQSKTPQYGEKITFWTISQQIEIEKPVLSGAALGKGKGGSPLDALKK
ncbi:MAG: hypothetical protein MJ240_02315 [Kiritimatiellae bacterium]|nr:hypothetical protein [Kiritimatiellia bacterium]